MKQHQQPSWGPTKDQLDLYRIVACMVNRGLVRQVMRNNEWRLYPDLRQDLSADDLRQIMEELEGHVEQMRARAHDIYG